MLREENIQYLQYTITSYIMKFSEIYYELKFPANSEPRKIITHEEIRRYGRYRAEEEAIEHSDPRGCLARHTLVEMAKEDNIYTQSL